MSEPSEAVYELAAVARIQARIPGTSVEAANEVLANELTRPLWLDRDLIAAVDAVWPLAAAQGRRQAAADIRAQITAEHVPPDPLRRTVLRANSVAEWAARIAEGADHA